MWTECEDLDAGRSELIVPWGHGRRGPIPFSGTKLPKAA